ncbi:MAG: hypothetical protein R3E55_05385 [Burkholderiaceae bacterium]
MMITILLLHGLCSLFLVGALSHQAAATWRRAPLAGRPAGVVSGFAAVRAPLYAQSIAISYVLTMVLGDVVYGPYRVDVKTMLFDLQLWPWNGLFEIKEHLVALGFFLLAPYLSLWGRPQEAAQLRSRRLLTTVLAAIVWYALLAGHLLNNLKGVGF